MPETNPTQPDETAQPGSATGATIAVSVEEAAAHFGISPQAVRKRIAAGHLEAERIGRSWSVYLPAQPAQPNETTTGAGFQETTKPPDAKLVAQSQRDQFALMVEPIVAPWVAKVEELSREAERNLVRAEAAEQRLAAAEQERDELRRLMEDALLFDPADEQGDDPDGAALFMPPENTENSPDAPEKLTVAPGRADPLNVSNESNNEAAGARRSVFEDLWHWLRGRR